VAKALPVLCVKFHEDVQALSARFLVEQRRHYYVTPTSYLELLGSYKKLLAKRQDEVRVRSGAAQVTCYKCLRSCQGADFEEQKAGPLLHTHDCAVCSCKRRACTGE
jgi:hypothetical protein